MKDRFLAPVRRFFAAAPDAIRGYLNVQEIGRAVIAGLIGGSSALAILEAVATNPGTFANPEVGSALVAVVIAVLDAYRRLGHENFGRPAR